MKLYPHPVFDIDLPPWWRYKAQMPPGVVFYVIPILIGLLVPQRWIRTYLLATSVLMLWLTFGHFFALAILGAAAVGWLMCLAGRAAAQRSRQLAAGVLIGGWAMANTLYFSMFALPVNRLMENATHLDVLLLCGPAFMLVRVLGLFTDICQGEHVGSLRPDRFALFVLFAPTFRLGPVTKYADVNEQLDRCKSQITWQTFRTGLFRLFFGLGILLLVDETIDEWIIDPYRDKTFFFIDGFFRAAPQLNWTDAVIGMYMIPFRFLVGFSGYSHIAIGLGMMIGLRLPQNFRWPYLATNLQQFWRRWHISLSNWLRDYLYIPLGGRDRRELAILVVFVYCFMWHQPGLNMLIFALLHTAGLIVFDHWRKWVDRQTERRTLLYRVAGMLRISGGQIGSILGILITFHFWTITLLVLFDPKQCGWGIIRRIFIDPLTAW